MTHADRDASEPRNANTGHGHVRPRPDGVRARCGGPGICSQCSREAALGAPHAAQERGDERWADWHNAMLIVGLGRTPQDALPRYVTEARRLADAEQSDLRAEVKRLREAALEFERAYMGERVDRLAAEAKVAPVEVALSRIEELAKVQATSCRAMHRADHERNWLDVLAIIERAALDGP